MMDSLREATKNTMFDQWLDAVQGGNGSDTGTPRIAPPAPTAGQAPSAVATPQQQQHQHMDAHMQLAEIAGYLAEGDAAGVSGASHCAAATAAGAGHVPSLPGMSAAAVQHQHEQRLLQQQTEVSGTVAESTNYVPGWEDIFNINQKQLEGAIRRVSNDPNLEPQRKAYLIQNIMVSRYIVSQQRRMRTQGSMDAAGLASAAAAAAAAAGGSTAVPSAGPGHTHIHSQGQGHSHGHAHAAGACCHHHQHGHHGQHVHSHGGEQQLAPAHQQQLLQPHAQPQAGSIGIAGAFAASAAAAAAGGVARQTYIDATSGILGCKHYRRAARLVAPCCGQVFTCR